MTASPSPRPRRDLLAFDRADRWGLGIVLGVIVLLALYVDLLLPLSGWVDGDGLQLAVSTDVEVPRLDTAGLGYGPADLLVTVPDPTTLQRVLDLAPGVLTMLLLATGSWLALSVMRTVAAGDPFVPANVRRLRVLALMLMLGPALVLVGHFASQASLLDTAAIQGLPPQLSIDIPFIPLVAGLFVALLAEAFRAGNRLRDDVEGLV